MYERDELRTLEENQTRTALENSKASIIQHRTFMTIY